MRGPDFSFFLTFSFLLCGLTSFSQGQEPGRESKAPRIIAAGSGVNLGITRILAESFMKKHPDIRIEVPGSIGTNGAIKAVADGAIALGLTSRPLNEQERTLGLTALPYARTAIVVAVNPSVEDEEITFEDLINIYKGEKSRWKDGKEIVVLSREKFDSGFAVLSEKIPGFKAAHAESVKARRWSVYFNDQDLNRALTTRPDAIGVTDLGMISTEQLNVKVLKINGFIPTPEDAYTGRYPLVRELFFIYRQEKLPERAKAFIDFVMSDEGANILKSQRYVCMEQEK